MLVCFAPSEAGSMVLICCAALGPFFPSQNQPQIQPQTVSRTIRLSFEWEIQVPTSALFSRAFLFPVYANAFVRAILVRIISCWPIWWSGFVYRSPFSANPWSWSRNRSHSKGWVSCTKSEAQHSCTTLIFQWYGKSALSCPFLENVSDEQAFFWLTLWVHNLQSWGCCI